MPQEELKPVVSIKAENVDRYVKSIVALTNANEPPIGEVTAPQMNLLIHALLNYAYRIHQREVFSAANPE